MKNSYVRRIENERRTFCSASRFELITGFERRIFLRASRKQPVRKENHTNADVEHSYVHVRVKRKDQPEPFSPYVDFVPGFQ